MLISKCPNNILYLISLYFINGNSKREPIWVSEKTGKYTSKHQANP